MREILLDTETTGFSPENGDRIVEIGAVELLKKSLTGNNYHQYLNPKRFMPKPVIKVHGITDEFLLDKPYFESTVDEFMKYISGARVIIHNAKFDVKFINAELELLRPNKWGKIEDHCEIIDSLEIAKKKYPGQRNSLDAICKRLKIDNSNRTLHGALLDSEILAEVYLRMNQEQQKIKFKERDLQEDVSITKGGVIVTKASSEELIAHNNKIFDISKKSGEDINW